MKCSVVHNALISNKVVVESGRDERNSFRFWVFLLFLFNFKCLLFSIISKSNEKFEECQRFLKFSIQFRSFSFTKKEENNYLCSLRPSRKKQRIILHFRALTACRRRPKWAIHRFILHMLLISSWDFFQLNRFRRRHRRRRVSFVILSFDFLTRQ